MEVPFTVSQVALVTPSMPAVFVIAAPLPARQAEPY